MDMCLGSAQGLWPRGYSHVVGFVIDSPVYQYLLVGYSMRTGEAAVTGAMIPPTEEDEIPQWAFDALHSWADPTIYTHVVGIYHPFSPMDVSGAKHGGYLLFHSAASGVYRLMLVHPGGRLNLCRAGRFQHDWTLIIPFDQAQSPHPVILLYARDSGRYEVLHIPSMRVLADGFMHAGWTDIVPKKPAPHRWLTPEDGAYARGRKHVNLSRPGSAAAPATGTQRQQKSQQPGGSEDTEVLHTRVAADGKVVGEGGVPAATAGGGGDAAAAPTRGDAVGVSVDAAGQEPEPAGGGASSCDSPSPTGDPPRMPGERKKSVRKKKKKKSVRRSRADVKADNRGGGGGDGENTVDADAHANAEDPPTTGASVKPQAAAAQKRVGAGGGTANAGPADPSTPQKLRGSRNRFFCYNSATGRCGFEILRDVPLAFDGAATGKEREQKQEHAQPQPQGAAAATPAAMTATTPPSPRPLPTTSDPATHSRRRPGCRLVAMDCGYKSCCILYRHTNVVANMASPAVAERGSEGATKFGTPAQSFMQATPPKVLSSITREVTDQMITEGSMSGSRLRHGGPSGQQPLLSPGTASSQQGGGHDDQILTQSYHSQSHSTSLRKRLSWEMDVHGPLPEVGASQYQGTPPQPTDHSTPTSPHLVRKTSFATPLSRSLSGSMLTKVRADGAEMLLSRSIGVNRDAWTTIVALPPLPVVNAVHARHLLCYSAGSGQWWICTMTVRVSMPENLRARRPSPPRMQRTLAGPGDDARGAYGVEWPGATLAAEEGALGRPGSTGTVGGDAGGFNSTGQMTMVSAVSTAGGESRATAVEQRGADREKERERDRLERMDWSKPWTHARWERVGTAKLEAQHRRELEDELVAMGWARDVHARSPAAPTSPNPHAAGTTPTKATPGRRGPGAAGSTSTTPMIRGRAGSGASTTPTQAAGTWSPGSKPAASPTPPSRPSTTPQTLPHTSPSGPVLQGLDADPEASEDDARASDANGTVLVAAPGWDSMTLEGILEDMNLHPFYRATGYAEAALREVRRGRGGRAAAADGAGSEGGSPRRWVVRQMHEREAVQMYSPRPPGSAGAAARRGGSPRCILPPPALEDMQSSAASRDGALVAADDTASEADSLHASKAWMNLTQDEQDVIALGLLRDSPQRPWSSHWARPPPATLPDDSKTARLEARVTRKLAKAKQSAAPPSEERTVILSTPVDRERHQQQAFDAIDRNQKKVMVKVCPKHTQTTQNEMVTRLHGTHARTLEKLERMRDPDEQPVMVQGRRGRKGAPKPPAPRHKVEAACEAVYEHQVALKVAADERARAKYIASPAPSKTVSREEAERSGKRMYDQALESQRNIDARREATLKAPLVPQVVLDARQMQESAARLYANEPRSPT